MSCVEGAYPFARFPELLIAARRQRTNNNNRQVYSPVDPCQQTNELLQAESLESSELNVRHPRFMHPKDARCNTLVFPSKSGDDSLSELFLQAWNRIIDHS